MKKLSSLTAALLLTSALAAPVVVSGADAKADKPKPYPLKTCITDGEKLGSMGGPYAFTSEGREIVPLPHPLFAGRRRCRRFGTRDIRSRLSAAGEIRPRPEILDLALRHRDQPGQRSLPLPDPASPGPTRCREACRPRGFRKE